MKVSIVVHSRDVMGDEIGVKLVEGLDGCREWRCRCRCLGDDINKLGKACWGHFGAVEAGGGGRGGAGPIAVEVRNVERRIIFKEVLKVVDGIKKLMVNE